VTIEVSEEHCTVDDFDRTAVSIIPLGGLGEVGMNCTAFVYAGEIVIVDCGVNFPEERAYGVDLIVPLFTFLTDNSERVKALIVTHGHEDHIGAIPFLLREINVPIYGPPLAMAMIAERLQEHGLYEHASLNDVSAGEQLDVGSFQFEFIHVNHSIPQSNSLAIRTPAGLIVHSGDFKIDHQPVDDDPIDLNRFSALGEEGVVCLLSDSTNVENEGFTMSEGAVSRNLFDVISRVPGRAFVTLFSSNIYRIQSLLDIAQRLGRKVVALGRSLERSIRIGRELGLLHLPDEGILVDINDARVYRHDELLVIVAGSQGEPRGTLTRIALDDHPHLHMLPGDHMIFSSRVIPGNERAVSRIINHLHRRGATVITYPKTPVHASGHACQEEQKLLINLLDPDLFVPIHGEYRHLVKHAGLAESLGVDTLLIENGEVLSVNGNTAEVVGTVPVGRVMVAGKGMADGINVALQDRRKLARTGLVVAWLVIDGTTGVIVSGPELLTQGVMAHGTKGDLIQMAIESAKAAIGELNLESRCDPAEVAEATRLAIRRVFNKHLDTKPVVVPIVHRL